MTDGLSASTNLWLDIWLTGSLKERITGLLDGEMARWKNG